MIAFVQVTLATHSPDNSKRFAKLIDGLEEVQRQFGEWILDSYIPPTGTATQAVEAGYMANAWIRIAHPDFDTVHHMLNVAGQSVRVHAS